ncbi:MAG TPA: hypothetical protein GX526_04125 [Thermoanaerobacterales bacterium]|nr:hypothetical protein [Thermoanaerobacterales bacterium]
MSKHTVFHSGVLEERDGELVQIGHKCHDCGKTSFPAVELCIYCSSANIEKVPLSTIGKVFAYSITRVPVGVYKPPIIGAYIDLPEGVRIYGQIHTDEKNMRTGMKVRMETGIIFEKEDGTEVLGYYYVPFVGKEGDI